MSVQTWKVLCCDCEDFPYVCEVYERLDNKPTDMVVGELLKMMNWKICADGTLMCGSCFEAREHINKEKEK